MTGGCICLWDWVGWMTMRSGFDLKRCARLRSRDGMSWRPVPAAAVTHAAAFVMRVESSAGWITLLLQATQP